MNKNDLKEKVLAILKEYRQDLSCYDPCGPTFGVSEDDYEKVAEKIVAELVQD